SAVRGFEDDGAAVRAGVLLVKLGDQRLPENIPEQNRLCARVRHAKTSVPGRKLRQHSLSTTRRSSCSSHFTKLSGLVLGAAVPPPTLHTIGNGTTRVR